MGNILQKGRSRKQVEVSVIQTNVWQRLHDSIIRCDVETCKLILWSNGGNVDRIYALGLANHEHFGGQVFNRTIRTPPLHLACMFRRRDIVQLLLADGQADPGFLDKFGRPPAMLALQYWPRLPYDKTMVIDRMESEDAHFWKRIGDQHFMSLACMTMLLEKRIDASAVLNDREETLLHVCARYNLSLAVNLLLSYNANIEAKDIDGCTPLMLAVKLWRYETLHEFMRHGADFTTTDKYGKNIFHHLCSCRRVDIESIAIFMDIYAEVDINSQDSEGNTPLHICALCEDKLKLEYLLERGADTDIKNNNGQTVLYLVLDSQDNDMLICASKVLPEMTRICVVDSNGSLPLRLTTENLVNDLGNKLVILSKNPPSLYRICMQKVRQNLGRTRDNKLKTINLQCPESMGNTIHNYAQNGRVYWSHYFEKLLL